METRNEAVEKFEEPEPIIEEFQRSEWKNGEVSNGKERVSQLLSRRLTITE